jgi:hypothetical protein
MIALGVIIILIQFKKAKEPLIILCAAITGLIVKRLLN